MPTLHERIEKLEQDFQEQFWDSTRGWGDRIKGWSDDRNLTLGSTPEKQYVKLREECEELRDAILAKDYGEMIDAIGDIQVVLGVMCAQLGLNIDECREAAWNEIKDRTGKMVDGVFVKDKEAIALRFSTETSKAKNRKTL